MERYLGSNLKKGNLLSFLERRFVLNVGNCIKYRGVV